MSEEIKELDNKYLVLKWDDIGKYLTLSQKEELHEIIKTVTIGRALFNLIPQNQYLVLNLDDEISLDSLINSLKYWYISDGEFAGTYHDVRVKRIAVALVNAILKVKGD